MLRAAPGRSPERSSRREIVHRVSELADAVLPLIRTRADLWRWSAANEHGRQMQDAVVTLAPSDRAEPCPNAAVTTRSISGIEDESRCRTVHLRL
jgi:hypothetical protein